MKIAIIGHKRIPSNEGGIEKGVEQHAVRMVELGHDVVVFNRGNSSRNDKLKEYKGVKVITIPTTNGKAEVPIYSFLSTLKVILGKFDVISYRASGSCVMIPIAKLFGVKCIASIHGIDSKRKKWGRFASWYLNLGEKFAAKYSDECLVLSENMKSEFDNKYNCDSIIFANGIDKPNHESLNKVLKKFPYITENDYFLYLGRLVPEKGVEYLIDAFKNVNTSKKLVIAGGADDKAYFNLLEKKANMDKRIIFTGFVKGSTVNELYSNSYAFILPSDLEGMSNSLLEAMSYGNCCLVSDIPENMQVIEDKGLTFEKGNTEDLQQKIQLLVDNNLLTTKYKNVSSNYILNRFSWDSAVEQMLDIYNGEINNFDEYYVG